MRRTVSCLICYIFSHPCYLLSIFLQPQPLSLRFFSWRRAFVFVLVLQVLFKFRRWVDCVGCEHRDHSTRKLASVTIEYYFCRVTWLVMLSTVLLFQLLDQTPTRLSQASSRDHRHVAQFAQVSWPRYEGKPLLLPSVWLHEWHIGSKNCCAGTTHLWRIWLNFIWHSWHTVYIPSSWHLFFVPPVSVESCSQFT